MYYQIYVTYLSQAIPGIKQNFYILEKQVKKLPCFTMIRIIVHVITQHTCSKMYNVLLLYLQMLRFSPPQLYLPSTAIISVV